MANFTLGSLIHHRPTGSEQPLWPAIVCPDDVASEDFLRTRPPGYVTLVLRIGESLEFQWALATEMHEYNPFYPFEEEDTVANTPGLGEAYAIANSALESGLGLDHWKAQVRSTAIVISSGSEDGEGDVDLRRAIRESRESFYGKKPTQARMTSTSTFEWTSRESDINHEDFQEFDEPKPQGEQPRHKQRIRTTPSPFSDDELYSFPKLESAPKPAHAGAKSIAQKGPKQPKSSLSSASKIPLSWDRLGNSSAPTSDVVEEEITASKEFVLVYVGPNGEQRTLQKNHVWEQPYFKDSVAGINHFELNDAGIWVLSHPSLSEIDPEDFIFVAEYLESKEFGHRSPEGGEEVQEAFAQNMSAWTAAVKLGMTDLLEDIVKKLERLAPWDMWDIMAFACHVFGSPGPSLPAQDLMKDMLTTEIAQNFWVYLEDDHLSESFRQRLKELPELERDIYVKRIAALNVQLHTEEGESDNGDMDIDMG
ncbi:Nn.00g087460.m01.CDS01 [Neocucurbitaria sp. VM-36]